MQTAKEITVILRGEDKTYREKFLIYDDVLLSSEDPIIKECIERAKSSCKGLHEEISIKIHMQF